MGEVASALSPESFAAAPDTGVTVRCNVIRVIDGDTIEVMVPHVYRVRLLECWAPEVHGTSKQLGLQSKSHLRNFLQDHGLRGTLSVPCGEDISKAMTLGRVLGNVWLDGQEKSLSEIQCEAGHATKEKP